MQVFLVGGAVRDELLGLEVVDRDWVVVGSSPEELLNLGYQPVGKDFPVFLHPVSREEYALARTERKTGSGYHGFSFYASPDVTLEQDLSRRDLTINAMAKSIQGELIDPFHGAADLKAKVFRHVSTAFQEDPLRVLRMARFAARWPDFKVASETLSLAQAMVQHKEIEALVAERVWTEFAKGLMYSQPSRLFEVLMDCNAFGVLMPDLLELEVNPKAKQDFFKSLNAAAQRSCSLEIRFALCLYPYSIKHLSTTQAQGLCESLKAPASCKELALLVLQLAQTLQKTETLNAQNTLSFLEALDGFRRPQRLQEGFEACAIAAKNMHDDCSSEHLLFLKKSLECALALNLQELSASALSLGLKGTEIGQFIHDERLRALNTLLEK
jgi:tRNA nucleotidyltransferase (CCA-adding enzyme)